MSTLTPYLNVAVRAAKTAGGILKRGLTQPPQVSYKDDTSLVTDVDIRAEQAIIAQISRRFPDHDILSEEGQGKQRCASYRWIIDPLDGTTNYVHRFPFFCVSVGLEYRGRMVVGVAYDPIRRELFHAERGSGAYLNGQPIVVSSVGHLDHALLVTGFSQDIRTRPGNAFTVFQRVSRKVQAVRRSGSSVLDLCYVAAGRLDGFWEMKLKPWDTAAGSLILIEAGGRISNFSGKRFSIYDLEVLASNRRLHAGLLSAISP